MMKRFKIWALALMMAGASVAVAQEEAVPDSSSVAAAPAGQSGAVVAGKVQADEAYAAGNYSEAARLYEQIIAEQGVASAVYYNLGNCYYKTSELGKAILNYERALLLNPGDTDARFNLELARSKTVDKITPLSELFFVTWAKDFANLQGTDAWARTAIVCFIVCLLSSALYLFSRKPALRKVAFFVALFLVVVCIVANAAASYQKSVLEERTQAIVMQPSVTVKSTPDNSGTDLFVLHEGCKVEIKDNSMRGWKEIRLADGNVGWIPVEAIEVI